MTKTITVPNPKTLEREKDLVLIPKREYKDLLERAAPVVFLTPAEKRRLNQARKEMKKGEYYTLQELEHELGITRQKKSRKATRKVS